MRNRFAVALLALTLALGTARACPFCSVQGQTLAGEVNQADLIVLGTLKNAKQDPNDITKGTTELSIDSIVKDHPFLKGKKTLILPRYIRIDPAAANAQTLVFCGLYSTATDTAAAAVGSTAVLVNFDRYQLDPYRGDELEKDSKLPQYLKGAFAVREKDVVSRLCYFFDYLDSPESKIATDAFLEFANADYKDVQAASAKLNMDKLLGWLEDKQTPASRFGLYGMILGHSKKPAHAAALRAILDDPKKQYTSGLDGVLAGYIMLDTKAGWPFLMDILTDEKKDFQVRYAGLRVLRFFWDNRPDVVTHDKIVEGMKVLVAQSDIADLPIEDLRKWDRTDVTAWVLENGQKESHKQIPIVRRAVLRFALTVEGKSEAAKAFVHQSEKDDAERVKLVREMLADEKPKPAEATTMK
ncbi:hypothetical protein [Limnoglobus roseus]|uniref:RES domain-containing protein n=1 Tax=Limnoglobus roseus TaxID=2598579 RepID=A0A5C1AQD6_9BACT|nr:hypothetical protein [Limnoglobus roseus]QEL19394.1 RES domain-containing protein [Limnoglobus roseus]